MLLSKLNWSPDEAGTYISSTEEPPTLTCHTYSTHKHFPGGYGAYFNPGGSMAEDGNKLGVFPTQAEARAACQRHWDNLQGSNIPKVVPPTETKSNGAHKLESKTGSRMYLFESMTEVTKYIRPDLFRVRGDGFVGEDLPTWDKVSERTTRDWAEGMYILSQYVEKLSKEPLPEIKSHKRQVKFVEADGDEVDFDKLRAGQPFWRKSVREETTGPTTVTIITDTTTPCSRNPEDILWRGAAALALTILLEAKGYGVEVWVVNGSHLFGNGKKPVFTACCLKRCSDPLDQSTLVNMVAGWFYRTVTFTLLETICKNENRKPESGYGMASSPVQDDLDLLTSDELRFYSSGVYSFNGALDVIRSELEKVNEKP
jgi:hypothetical protein